MSLIRKIKFIMIILCVVINIFLINNDNNTLCYEKSSFSPVKELESFIYSKVKSSLGSDRTGTRSISTCTARTTRSVSAPTPAFVRPHKLLAGCLKTT